jgi:hypothetical protein
MGLKITFVFAMRHYAGNDLKREPSLQRACGLEANASFPAEGTAGALKAPFLALYGCGFVR